MKLTLIQVPYDSGHFGARMGRGPLHLIEQGLAGTLERAGHEGRGVRAAERLLEALAAR